MECYRDTIGVELARGQSLLSEAVREGQLVRQEQYDVPEVRSVFEDTTLEKRTAFVGY